MKNVLVVEDNTVTQRLLSYRLETIGCEAIIAENGLDALRILALPETPQIHLAIVDIAMPEMDGLTLLVHLRSDPRFQTLPVIILSASGEESDWSNARELGANAFLTKPVSSWELIETIHQFLIEA